MTDNQTLLSATEMIARAPLGAIIRYTDLTPEPPTRFKNKHSQWKRNNDCGRLVSVSHPRDGHEGTFTLHTGDYGSHGVVVLTIRKTFHLSTSLSFAIQELPKPGSVAVLTKFRDQPELHHIAASRADAESWLHSNPYTDAYLEEIADDKTSAPKIATLADFKRALSEDSRWEIRFSFQGPNTGPAGAWNPRQVVKRQTNAVAFAKSFDPTVVAHAKANPEARASWLHFPKASAFSFPEPGIVRVTTSPEHGDYIEYRLCQR